MVDRMHIVSPVTAQKSNLPVESDAAASMVVSEKVSGPAQCESAPEVLTPCAYSGSITMVQTVDTGIKTIHFPNSMETSKEFPNSEWQPIEDADNSTAVMSGISKRPLGKWIDVSSCEKDKNSRTSPENTVAPIKVTLSPTGVASVTAIEAQSEHTLSNHVKSPCEPAPVSNSSHISDDFVSECKTPHTETEISKKDIDMGDKTNASFKHDTPSYGDDSNIQSGIAKEDFTASLQLRRNIVCPKQTENQSCPGIRSEYHKPEHLSKISSEAKGHRTSSDSSNFKFNKDTSDMSTHRRTGVTQHAFGVTIPGSMVTQYPYHPSNTHCQYTGYTNSISISKVSENEYKSTLKSHRPCFRAQKSRSSRMLRLCMRGNRIRVSPVIVDARDKVFKVQLPKTVRKKKFLQQIAHSRAVVRLLRLDKNITKINVYSKPKKRSTKSARYQTCGRKSPLNLRKRPKIHPKDERLHDMDDMDFRSDESDSASDTCYSKHSFKSERRSSSDSGKSVVLGKSKRMYARKSTSWDYKRRLATMKGKSRKHQFEKLSDRTSSDVFNQDNEFLMRDQSADILHTQFDYTSNVDGDICNSSGGTIAYTALDLSSCAKNSTDGSQLNVEPLYYENQQSGSTMLGSTEYEYVNYDLNATDLSMLESRESVEDVVSAVIEDIIQKVEAEEDTMTLVIDTVVSLQDTTCQLAQDIPQDAHWHNGVTDDGANPSTGSCVLDAVAPSHSSAIYTQPDVCHASVTSWPSVALESQSGPSDSYVTTPEVLNLCKKKTDSSSTNDTHVGTADVNAPDNESSSSPVSTSAKEDDNSIHEGESTGDNDKQNKDKSSVVHEEDLPTIRPPKRRRRKVPSPPRYSENDRLKMELPRHNWLIEKLRGNTVSTPPISTATSEEPGIEDDDEINQDRLVIDENNQMSDSLMALSQSQSSEIREEHNSREEVLDLSSSKTVGAMTPAEETGQFESDPCRKSNAEMDQKVCQSTPPTNISFSTSPDEMIKVHGNETNQAASRTMPETVTTKVHVIQPTSEDNSSPTTQESLVYEDQTEQSVKTITVLPPVMPVVLQPHPCVVAITGLPAVNTVPLVTNYIMDKNATVTNNVVVKPSSFSSNSQEVVVSTEVVTASTSISTPHIVAAPTTQNQPPASSQVTNVGPTVISIQPIPQTSPIPSSSQVNTHHTSGDPRSSNHGSNSAAVSIIHQSPFPTNNNSKFNESQMINPVNTSLPPHIWQLERDFEKHRRELLELQEQVSMNEKQRECLLQQRQSKIQSLCLLEVERNKVKDTMKPPMPGITQDKNVPNSANMSPVSKEPGVSPQRPPQLGISTNYITRGMMQRNPGSMYSPTSGNQAARGMSSSFPRFAPTQPPPGMVPRVPGAMMPPPQFVNPTVYKGTQPADGSHKRPGQDSNQMHQTRFPPNYQSVVAPVSNKQIPVRFHQHHNPSSSMPSPTQPHPFPRPQISDRASLPNPHSLRNSPALGSASNPIQIPSEHDHRPSAPNVCPHHHPHHHTGGRPTQMLRQAHQNRNLSYLKLRLGPNAVPRPAHGRKPSVSRGRIEKRKPLGYSSIFIPRKKAIECPPGGPKPRCHGPPIAAHTKKSPRAPNVGAKHACCHSYTCKNVQHTHQHHHHHHQIQQSTTPCRCSHLCSASPHGHTMQGARTKCVQHQATNPELRSPSYCSNAGPFIRSPGIISTPPMPQQHGYTVPGTRPIQRSPIPQHANSPNGLHAYSRPPNTYSSQTPPINYQTDRNPGAMFIRPPCIQPSNNAQVMHLGPPSMPQIPQVPPGYPPSSRPLNLHSMPAPTSMPSPRSLVHTHHNISPQASPHTIPPNHVGFKQNAAALTCDQPVRLGYPVVNPPGPTVNFPRMAHPSRFPVAEMHQQINAIIPQAPTMQTFETKAASDFGELNNPMGNNSHPIPSHHIPCRRRRRKISDPSGAGGLNMTKKQKDSYNRAPTPVLIETLPDHIRAQCDVGPSCIKKVENANATSTPISETDTNKTTIAPDNTDKPIDLAASHTVNQSKTTNRCTESGNIRDEIAGNLDNVNSESNESTSHVMEKGCGTSMNKVCDKAEEHTKNHPSNYKSVNLTDTSENSKTQQNAHVGEAGNQVPYAENEPKDEAKIVQIVDLDKHTNSPIPNKRPPVPVANSKETTKSSSKDDLNEVTVRETKGKSLVIASASTDTPVKDSCHNAESNRTNLPADDRSSKTMAVATTDSSERHGELPREESGSSTLAVSDELTMKENATKTANNKTSDESLEIQSRSSVNGVNLPLRVDSTPYKNITETALDPVSDANDNTASESDSSDAETMLHSSNSNLYSACITSPTSPSPTVQTDAEVKVIPLAMMQDSSDEGKDAEIIVSAKTSIPTSSEHKTDEILDYRQGNQQTENGHKDCSEPLVDKSKPVSKAHNVENDPQTTTSGEPITVTHNNYNSAQSTPSDCLVEILSETPQTKESNESAVKGESASKESEMMDKGESELHDDSKISKPSSPGNDTDVVTIELSESEKSCETPTPEINFDNKNTTETGTSNENKDAHPREETNVFQKSGIDHMVPGIEAAKNSSIAQRTNQSPVIVLTHMEESSRKTVANSPSADVVECTPDVRGSRDKSIAPQGEVKTKKRIFHHVQTNRGPLPDSAVHFKQSRNPGLSSGKGLMIDSSSMSVDHRRYAHPQSLPPALVSHQSSNVHTISTPSSLANNQVSRFAPAHNSRFPSSKSNMIPRAANPNMTSTQSSNVMYPTYDLTMKSNTSRISPQLAQMPMTNQYQTIAPGMTSVGMPMPVPPDTKSFPNHPSNLYKCPPNGQNMPQVCAMENRNQPRFSYPTSRNNSELPPKHVHQVHQTYNPHQSTSAQAPGINQYNRPPMNSMGHQYHREMTEPQTPRLHMPTALPQPNQIPGHGNQCHTAPAPQPQSYPHGNPTPVSVKYNPTYPQVASYQQAHMVSHESNTISPQNPMYSVPHGAATVHQHQHPHPHAHPHPHTSPVPQIVPHKVQHQSMPHPAQGLVHNPQMMNPRFQHGHPHLSHVPQKHTSGHVENIQHMPIKQQLPTVGNPVQVPHHQSMPLHSPHQPNIPPSHGHSSYPANAMASPQQQMVQGHSYSTNHIPSPHHGQQQAPPQAMFGPRIPTAHPEIRPVTDRHVDNQHMCSTHGNMQVMHDTKPPIQSNYPHVRHSCYSGQQPGIPMEQPQPRPGYPSQPPHLVHIEPGSSTQSAHHHQTQGVPMMGQQQYPPQMQMRMVPQEHIARPPQPHVGHPTYQEHHHMTPPDDSNKALHSLDTALPECHVCKLDANFLCAGCQNVWYCSVACQSTAWKSHSAMCYPTGVDRRM